MEKKQIKITLKTIMIIVFFVTAVIIGGVFIYNSYPRFEVRTLDGKEYYMIINDKKWCGKYNKQRNLIFVWYIYLAFFPKSSIFIFFET